MYFLVMAFWCFVLGEYYSRDLVGMRFFLKLCAYHDFIQIKSMCYFFNEYK
jgi:hypothetical protein